MRRLSNRSSFCESTITANSSNSPPYSHILARVADPSSKTRRSVERSITLIFVWRALVRFHPPFSKGCSDPWYVAPPPRSPDRKSTRRGSSGVPRRAHRHHHTERETRSFHRL